MEAKVAAEVEVTIAERWETPRTASKGKRQREYNLQSLEVTSKEKNRKSTKQRRRRKKRDQLK